MNLKERSAVLTVVPTWAVAVLCLGAVGIAFAPIFVRWSEVDPVATAVWRVGLALPLLFVIEGVRSRPSSRLPISKVSLRKYNIFDHTWLALAGVFFAGDLALWHWSIKLTSVANATVLANMAPIFVVLFSSFLFQERITLGFLVGLALAVMGVFLLFADHLQIGDAASVGNLLGIGTAVFYAAYQLSISRLRRRFGTVTVMIGSSVGTFVVLLPLAVATETALWPATTFGWLAVVGLAVVSHVGGQGLIAYALAFLPAPFSSVTLLLQPVLAALLAWLLLAEALSSLQILGGFVILGGVFLARRAVQQSVATSRKSEV